MTTSIGLAAQTVADLMVREPKVLDAAATLEQVRSLPVVDEDSTLLGLLCLKASHTGFFSDRDVQSRAHAGTREGGATVRSARGARAC